MDPDDAPDPYAQAEIDADPAWDTALLRLFAPVAGDTEAIDFDALPF